MFRNLRNSRLVAIAAVLLGPLWVPFVYAYAAIRSLIDDVPYLHATAKGSLKWAFAPLAAYLAVYRAALAIFLRRALVRVVCSVFVLLGPVFFIWFLIQEIDWSDFGSDVLDWYRDGFRAIWSGQL